MDKLSTMSPEHKLLKMIGARPSRLMKKKILTHYKKSTKLRNIFLYALDPFKKYFIKKFPGDVVGAGDAVIDETTWGVLDKLSHRLVVGKAAKDMLFGHMKNLTAAEAELLKRIVLHDLRVGVAASTVNDVWPRLIIERFIQKAEDWDAEQAVWPCYAGLKLDGIRADYKSGVFTARSGHIINGLDHIAEYIESRGGGFWDGELIVPLLSHLGFDTVSGYIRSGKKAKPEARFVVFDNLTIPTLKQSIRLGSLPKQFDRYEIGRRQANAPATYLKHILMSDEDHLMTYFSRVLDAGHEGLMVKHPRARYRACRTYNWMKLKKGDSAEFEIVDYFEGDKDKGRAGTLGGIIVQTKPGVTSKVDKGFSDKERDRLWKEPGKMLGKLATINFMELTKYGKFRHSAYKNIRWDL